MSDVCLSIHPKASGDFQIENIVSHRSEYVTDRELNCATLSAESHCGDKNTIASIHHSVRQARNKDCPQATFALGKVELCVLARAGHFLSAA